METQQPSVHNLHERDFSEPVFKAGHQSGENPYEFVLSDESVDRVGDVIRADGWKLKDFKRNPIALFGHSHDKIIGVWKNVRVEGKRLLATLQLAEPGTSELVDTTRKLIEQGILRAVSVGFRPTKGQPRNKEEPWNGYEYTEQSLHEASMVAVPCNANALQMGKAFCSQETADIVFARLDEERCKDWDNPPGKSAFEVIPTPSLDKYKERFKAFDIY